MDPLTAIYNMRPNKLVVAILRGPIFVIATCKYVTKSSTYEACALYVYMDSKKLRER